MPRRRARCSSSSAAREQLLVGPQEAVLLVPLALHERVPHEQLAGQLGVARAEGYDAVRDQRDAVQRDALVGHRGGPLGRPVRLAELPLDQVTAEALGPERVDGGVLPAPEPARLDELGRHHEVRRLLEQPGTGEDLEPGAAGAEVVAPVRVAQADVREQPREQRLVDAVLVRPLGGRARLDAHLAGDLPQLGLELLPLAHPQVVQVLLRGTSAGRRSSPSPSAACAGGATG